MKSAYILPAIVAAALFVAGCNKEESPAQGPDAQQTQADLKKAAEQAKADAKTAADKAKADAEKAKAEAEKAKKDLGNTLKGISK